MKGISFDVIGNETGTTQMWSSAPVEGRRHHALSHRNTKKTVSYHLSFSFNVSQGNNYYLSPSMAIGDHKTVSRLKGQIKN